MLFCYFPKKVYVISALSSKPKAFYLGVKVEKSNVTLSITPLFTLV